MRKPNLSKLAELKQNKKGSGKPSITDDPEALSAIENELAEKNQFEQLEDTVLKLSDYLAAVEMVVKETFDHRVWVKAEIRNLSSKSGHHYFELAEKDDAGQVVASCRGTLWRFKAERILAKFERATGMPLSRDLTVLLKVAASFHPLYGFSLNIEDIDPNYTLGDLARQYAAMVDRLTGEGLIDANKRLSTPLDIKNVIVIAPEKAAGLGDFRADADRLSSTGACHFHYHYATFQGNHAPAEIRQAIVTAMQQFAEQASTAVNDSSPTTKTDTPSPLPDLMVIIRGGGAVGDLAYLNDYELAALVAEQPIPVWVGIGHERDKVILDEVAHTSFDTPSKVIAGITAHLSALVQRLQGYMQSIEKTSQRQFALADQSSQRLLAHIQSHTASQLTALQKDADHAFATIQQSAIRQTQLARRYGQEQQAQTQTLAQEQLNKAKLLSQQYDQNIHKYAKQQLHDAKKDCQHLRELILLQNPSRVLQQGYVLIQDPNTKQILSRKQQLSDNQAITLLMQDGQTSAMIADSSNPNANPKN